MSLKRMFLISTMLCMAVGAFAQTGRGTAEIAMKGGKISIDYGRPSLGGQASRLGEANNGMVWRLGMNEATHIQTSRDLLVAGKEVKAGKYTLWAKKVSGANWLLCFHPKTGVWGDPVLTDGYVAQLPLRLAKATTSVDQLTISLANAKGRAMIKVQWGKDLLSGSFDVK